MKLLFALSGLVVACSLWQGTDAAYGFTTCTREYVKVGCFKEKNTKMDLIVNDRDGHGHEIQWGNFKASLHSLACRCSEAARQGGYEYFSIRFWAECWAGKDRGALDAVIMGGKHFSNDCKNNKFAQCEDTHTWECAGYKYSEYIYMLEARAPESIDGGFSDWGTWTPCGTSCGWGEKIRERSCTEPEPVNGGKPCNGTYTDIAKCKKAECPVDGVLGFWSDFSTCSASCGEGVHSRTRDCSAPEHGGKPCPGALQQTEACNNGACPVDGKLGSWTAWTTCSQSCGNGTQERSRACTEPTHGGKACAGDLSQITTCFNKHCPVDGKLGPWSAYSACSASCGPGSKRRERTCEPPKYGGSPCSGVLFQDADCKLKECPVNGGWGAWKAGPCSKKCGSGTKEITRSCNKPAPMHGGAACAGPDTKSETCKEKECPVDCKWNVWGSYGKCSKTCGKGTQKRSRTNTPAKFGGKACTGSSTTSRSCEVKKCPVNGVWNNWNAWTACSKSCGDGGTHSRTRTCEPPKYGGSACSGVEKETKTCKVKECPVNGGWGAWSTAACSRTCGTGVKVSTRSCNKPTPKHGGAACPGSTTKSVNCKTKECIAISTQCANANWAQKFDKAGTVNCDDWKQFMTGLYRNAIPRKKDWWGKWQNGDDGIYLIEHASCCKISSGSGYQNAPTHCWHANNWKHGWDSNNRWVTCPNGQFMRGLNRSGGSRLHNIEAANCCKMGGAPDQWGQCYEQDISRSFDGQGWSKCKAGFIMVGMYRGGCDDLKCIEKFKCCQMKPRY